MSVTEIQKNNTDEPMGRCDDCDGTGIYRVAVDEAYQCHYCGGTGEVPTLLRNYPGEKAESRYVVRLESGKDGVFVVWDRHTGDRVQRYGSQVGANRLAFGLNLGWDLRSARDRADRGDRWAHAS